MLLGIFDVIRQDPILGVILGGVILGTLLFSLVVHEFSHALVALALGDTAQIKAGRLSLNPLRHLDPMGTLLLLFVGFGWAKPVQTNESVLRPAPVTGMALVGLAGPLSNILLAVVAAVPYRMGLLSFDQPAIGGLAHWQAWLPAFVLFLLVRWNILLAVFNLIPIPPLDGSWLLRTLLPRHLQTGRAYMQIAQYGTFAFVGLIGFQFLTGVSLIWPIINVPVNFLSRIIVGSTVL